MGIPFFLTGFPFLLLQQSLNKYSNFMAQSMSLLNLTALFHYFLLKVYVCYYSGNGMEVFPPYVP